MFPDARAARASAAGTALLCGVACFGSSGCGARDRSWVPPTRVFLLTVDTLRADHLSVYGYPRQTSPNLERLAEGSLVFKRAIAQWPRTGASFASLFTGRYPDTTGLTHRADIRVPDEYLTLPELFQGAGYETVAVISNPVLSTSLGWDTGFDEYVETWRDLGPLPNNPHKVRRRTNALEVTRLATPLLSRHAAAEKLFVWIHYTDTHAPYTLPRGVRNPFLGDPWDDRQDTVEAHLPISRLIGQQSQTSFYIAQYDANILLVDREIGALLDHAESLGLLEDALLIFTADHGESLGEHGAYFMHGELPFNASAHVPLIFKDYRRAGERLDVASAVELVDLYPTIGDLIGAAAPEGMEGDSLALFLGPGLRARGGGAAEDRIRYAFSSAGASRAGSRYYRTVQDAGWKLIFHPGSAGNSFDLFRTDEDPAETNDLAQAEVEQLGRLRSELFAWMEARKPPDLEQTVAEEADRETRRALKALGYVD